MKYLNQSKLMKAARLKYQISQMSLAKAAGVHMQNISNIERGICGISPKIARALHKIGVRWQELCEASAADHIENWKREFHKKSGSKRS